MTKLIINFKLILVKILHVCCIGGISYHPHNISSSFSAFWQEAPLCEISAFMLFAHVTFRHFYIPTRGSLTCTPGVGFYPGPGGCRFLTWTPSEFDWPKIVKLDKIKKEKNFFSVKYFKQ